MANDLSIELGSNFSIVGLIGMRVFRNLENNGTGGL